MDSNCVKYLIEDVPCSIDKSTINDKIDHLINKELKLINPVYRITEIDQQNTNQKRSRNILIEIENSNDLPENQPLLIDASYFSIRKFENKMNKTFQNSIIHQINSDQFLYEFLSTNKDLFNLLKTKLSEKFNSILLIRSNSFDIKIRDTINTHFDNSQLIINLKSYLEQFKNAHFEDYTINEKDYDIDTWDLIISYINSKGFEMKQIKISIYPNHVTFCGMKEALNKLKEDLNVKLQNQEKIVYENDSLSESEYKILILEDIATKCRNEIDKNLEIILHNQSFCCIGFKKCVDSAKSLMKSTIKCIKSKEFNMEPVLLNFFEDKRSYIENLLKKHNIKCLFEESNSSKLIITSLSDDSISDCINFFKKKFDLYCYELDEDSFELIKNKKFLKFLSDKLNYLKETNEEDQISTIIETKNFYCVGEKLIINRLKIEIEDFFESNKIFISDLTNEYSYQEIKYFQIVVYDRIKNIIAECESVLDIKNAFDININIDNNNLQIKTVEFKIKSNKFYFNKIQRYLKDYLNQIKIEEYPVANEQIMDIFSEKKVLNELSNLEKTEKCAIIPPIHQNYTKKSNKNIENNATSNFTIFYNQKIKLVVTNENIFEFNKADILTTHVNKKLEPVLLCKDIVKHAGNEVENDLKLILSLNNNQIPYGLAYYTNPGNLKNFKGIIHCVVDESNQINLMKNLKNSYFQALSECQLRNYKKIAFKIFNLAPEDKDMLVIQANLLIDSILNFFEKNFNSTSIEEIYFIDNKADLVSDLLIKISKTNNKLSLIDSGLIDNDISNDLIQIETIYGSIVDESLIVDAIVNSTNVNLKLETGMISSTILKLGGQTIQDELVKNYPNGLKNAEAAITNSGKLKNKKFIFHIAIKSWESDTPENNRNNLRSNIFSVLKLAESKQICSIAFPSLGTGNLNYPNNEIPKLMFNFVNEYFKNSKGSTSIKKVYFVIYNNDKNTVQAFKNYENSELKAVKNNLNALDKNIQELEIDLSGLKIRAYIGDIVQSSNDLILNPTNKNLGTDGNVCKKLIEQDQSLLNKLISLRKNFNSIGFCKAEGNLKCKLIVNVDVTTKKTSESILETLSEANSKKFESITVPVIGTGQNKQNSEKCCNEIFQTIKQFASSNKDENLKKIEICIHHQNKEFLNYFKKLMTNSKNEQQEINESNSINTKIKPLILVSNDKSVIQCVKNEIDKLIASEIETKEIKDDYLKELDKKSKSLIEKICKQNKVIIKWNNLDKICLTGCNKNILNCYDLILKQITDYANQKEKAVSAQLLAHKVEWQYLSKDSWISFNIFLNNELEKKYQTMNDKDYKIVLLDEKNDYFIADLKDLNITYKKNASNKSKLQRINIEKTNIKFKFPNNWEADKEFDLINLPNNHSEFIQVSDNLNKTGLQKIIKKIISIHRIQNKYLYIQYINYKQEIEKKNSSSEKILYHGTNEDCIENIWKNGFNRSYAGKNATAYGRGVYFARDSSYSHNYTDIKKGKLRGHMFINRVVVDRIAIGTSAMNVPPNGCDTTVDNLQNPSIFVIFKDAQAYPEYLLTYE